MKRYVWMVLLLLGSVSLKAQTGILKGKISTTDGREAEGVTILVKETRKSALSFDNGSFVIRGLKPGNYTIEVSHEGLQTVTSTVRILADQATELNLSLKETARQLEEVIVQAKRTANDKAVTIGKSGIAPKDLPQAVTIINQELIDNQQAQRLSDVLRNANGVYLATTRGSTQENFSARGYGITSNNLFKDGIRINSGAMPETGSLERVEVLKGSAAILFGNVAPGGVVNMVTKQPRFVHGGSVGIRAGSFGLFKPSFDVYGPLSQSLAFRLNGSFETADSYRDYVHSKRYYVNPSFLFKLGSKTELLLQGDYLDHSFTPDFGIGSIDNTRIPDVPRSAFFGTPWQYAHTRQTSATATIRHTLNTAWMLNGSVSYQRYNRDYFSTERIQALASGDWYRPLGRTRNLEDYYTAQVNLTGKFATGSLQHVLLLGMDADQYHATAYTYNQPAIYDTINILNPNKYRARTDIPVVKEIRVVKTPTFRFGAYVQDLISLTAQLKLLVGLRWSIQEAKAAATTDLNTGLTTLGAVKTDRAFSPRAGLVYQPTKNTSLFASYANSFVVNSGTDVYGNALKPSIVDQYELGIKNDLIQDKLTANITVYRIINNNLAQTAQFAADGVTPNSNTSLKALTGKTQSDGLEIDLSSQPVKGLSLLAGYSYNYIRYTKTPDVKGNFVEGERLQNSVGSTANASVFYSLRGWKFGGAFFYTGPRYAGFNNTKGQAQNYNRMFRVEGFATVDLSAGYTWQRLAVLAKLSNITNTFNYNTHENYSINPIPPTQLIATLSYRF
ncbi:TonB-dependent receptor [Sediminibacterium soli]|uniref:TonB-dependent receptor n=1 Tax=Sediminibacterium soli TaxID=2698829 RepID=UPI00137B705C|nr:TonB-dependent receptor [Sediminibacterium soli]NCI46777.1 TonB-dependent receptor [Sediminibacterium soli]